MSQISEMIGERLRAKRISMGWSQEYTAEQANLHPTYIGQVERGEKNITIESLAKICSALHYPMEEVLKHMISDSSRNHIADQCYELIIHQPPDEQELLYLILKNIIAYKKKTRGR
ncbi:MAG: helix-turn-helix transcriptional regulator [Lachnospiraceae bacterium]|nr:helix-turn-helix transcriptional regulator [Lachnospiraceae bacterium]